MPETLPSNSDFFNRKEFRFLLLTVFLVVAFPNKAAAIDASTCQKLDTNSIASLLKGARNLQERTQIAKACLKYRGTDEGKACQAYDSKEGEYLFRDCKYYLLDGRMKQVVQEDVGDTTFRYDKNGKPIAPYKKPDFVPASGQERGVKFEKGDLVCVNLEGNFDQRSEIEGTLESNPNGRNVTLKIARIGGRADAYYSVGLESYTAGNTLVVPTKSLKKSCD